MNWNELITDRARYSTPSVAARLVSLAVQPNMISFAEGMPDPGLYPVEELQWALSRVLGEEAVQSLRYAPPPGIDALRGAIAGRLMGRGIPTLPKNVLIVSGAAQGIALVGEVLLNPGDVVIVEEPTFPGALEIFGKHQVRFVGVPTDEGGLRTDLLAQQLAETPPKLIYTMPNLHNPLGVDLTADRRRKLLELAGEHGVPVLADDPYGELRYRGDVPPALRALDGAENVIYVGSFSKTIAPGIRLGWVEAPREIADKLMLAKKDSDRSSNHLMQRAVYHLFNEGVYDRHISRLIGTYRQKLDFTIKAIRELLPEGVAWTEPAGGFFIWVTLPGTLDGEEVFERCVERGVLFTPGVHFFHDKGTRNHIRLSFAVTPLEQIAEGIRRIAGVVKEMLWSARFAS